MAGAGRTGVPNATRGDSGRVEAEASPQGRRGGLRDTMGGRAVRRVRPPFVATEQFVLDFPRVHGFEARCCLCGQLVQPGQLVAWGKAWTPESVYHVRCRIEEGIRCA